MPVDAYQPHPSRPRPLTPHAPAVDFTRLNEFRELDGDLELVSEVVALFIADAPGRLAAIATAHARGNVALLSEAAHALKGSAANVGAEALVALSARIEEVASAGVIPPDMDSLHRRLHDSWVATRQELSAWLEAGVRAG